jgi:hypothetical protein
MISEIMANLLNQNKGHPHLLVEALNSVKSRHAALYFQTGMDNKLSKIP